MTDPTITITSAPEGFAVLIDGHPDAATLNATHPTHREARGYAGGLKMTRGWAIIDKSWGQA